MKRRTAALLVPLLGPLLIGAAEPKLVPDVSERKIDIIYSFTGAELLLFGAILYPGGRTPAATPDVVVVVRGPTEPLILREKQKVAGMWINAASARFRSVPSFYAVASSRPLASIVDARTAAIYELGVSNLQLSPASGGAPEEQRRFEAGLVELKKSTGLYTEVVDGVEISEGVLYRARINIPARVSVGRYTAETYLIRDGRVLAGAEREIVIGKSGFEGFTAMAAERWSLLYGLTAVALSLLLGWVAGQASQRWRR